MIFIDTRFEELSEQNESFSNSNYSFLKINKVCMAGAIISRIKAPPITKALVEKHVESGAVFVAFIDKYSRDENAVEDLLELGAKNIMVVYLGSAVHIHGKVKVAGIEFPNEEVFVKEKCKLAAIGINVFECPVFGLDVLLEETEKYLLSDDEIEVYPAYIKYRIIDDWRAMVASMPMIDFEKANYLYEKYGDVAVIDVLRDLTNPEKNSTGFGKIVCERLRDWIGIPTGFNLGLVWEEDE